MPPIHHLSSIYLYISQRSITKTDRQTDRHQRYASIPPNSNHQTHSNAHTRSQHLKKNPSHHEPSPPPSLAPTSTSPSPIKLNPDQIPLLKSFQRPPLALEPRPMLLSTAQIPPPGQSSQLASGLGLHGLAQFHPRRAVAREADGPGRGDGAAAVGAIAGAADEKGVTHLVQQGAEEL